MGRAGSDGIRKGGASGVPESEPDVLAALARRVAARTDEVVDAALDRLWAGPALAQWTRPETREPARAIAAGSIGREVEALLRWELPDEPPEEDLAAARAAVEYRAPVTVPLQCYRAGHAALWSAWVDAVDDLRLEGPRRRAALDDGAAFLFDYVDRCAAWVEAEHAEARDRALRGAEQQRMRTVLSALAGDPADESLLGYALDGAHVCVVAWGAHGDLAAEELAAALGAEALLAVSTDPETTWAWLRGADTGAAAGYEPPASTRVAIGGPADFRRAHAEAVDAQRVARRRAGAVTAYGDVGLEALGLLDEARAASFVARELGPLAAGAAREATMRATLAAYFACGQNAASTAARLRVHERTITNRVRAVEARLGHTVVARRAEIEMALRLRDVLEPDG
ncbi:MAG TPA: helix-turn-helix domain-containing protein [Solirubrobacteraceae bacterium]|jgi:hypothetical protein